MPATPSSSDGQTYKLSLIPSGIFRPQVQCVVAGGVVLNPASMLEEIDGLVARGVEVGSNLMISDRAHVIFPWHFEEDRLMDECTGGEAIGTTMRGIGPCYRDKVGRVVRRSPGRHVSRQLPHADRADCPGQEPDVRRPGRVGRRFSPRRGRDLRPVSAAMPSGCAPYVADTTAYLLDAVEAGKRMLFEGAQGALLDIDHGTFPFVTSSNSSGVGVSSGSGVPGRYITQGDRRHQGLQHAGRRRAVPHRTGQRDGPAHSRPGQRIWHGHPAAAALRLVRRRGRPLYGPAQRRRRAGRDAAGRAERACRR